MGWVVWFSVIGMIGTGVALAALIVWICDAIAAYEIERDKLFIKASSGVRIAVDEFQAEAEAEVEALLKEHVS